MTITEFIKNNPDNKDWLKIADRFYLTGTNKQKSDKVRKLYNSIYKNGNPNNVLVVGDLHLPFELDDYLDFCVHQYKRFNCGKVVFIGDIIDNHYQSFHESNPDGYTAGQELELCITKLKEWYKAFPDAIITTGNHDRLISRRAVSSNLSSRWFRPLNEVLGVPNWKFVDEHIYNDILYVHGEQSNATTKAQNEFRSVVSGHTHTEGYVKLLNGGKNFAMQVGTGIDFKSYAFAYAQRGKQPILSCGIILNQDPIIIPFSNDYKTK